MRLLISYTATHGLQVWSILLMSPNILNLEGTYSKISHQLRTLYIAATSAYKTIKKSFPHISTFASITDKGNSVLLKQCEVFYQSAKHTKLNFTFTVTCNIHLTQDDDDDDDHHHHHLALQPFVGFRFLSQVSPSSSILSCLLPVFYFQLFLDLPWLPLAIVVFVFLLV